MYKSIFGTASTVCSMLQTVFTIKKRILPFCVPGDNWIMLLAELLCINKSVKLPGITKLFFSSHAHSKGKIKIRPVHSFSLLKGSETVVQGKNEQNWFCC